MGVVGEPMSVGVCGMDLKFVEIQTIWKRTWEVKWEGRLYVSYRSKLLVSPLIAPEMVPYIFACRTTPFKEFKLFGFVTPSPGRI